MPDPRKTNRRQFLSGRAAVEAFGDLTHGIHDEQIKRAFTLPPTAQADETYLVQLARTAMACEFQVFLSADHPSHAPEAALKALDIVDQLEEQLSVYRESSDLCDINRRAAQQPVTVEAKLFGLLQRCVELFHQTDGAFDITAGPLSKVWGFYRREGKIPSENDLQDTLQRIGSEKILLKEQHRKVAFDRVGVELNLGGIGKGYALDQAAARLESVGVNNFLLHGGRSSVLARGYRMPAKETNNPWTVGIGHPLRADRRLGLLRLQNQAMSTSASGLQSFRHQGKQYGHILDPRTGHPASGVLSVTVVCDDAATADALSTALYVLGVDRSEAFCQQHPEIAAIVVLPTSGGQHVEVLSLNLSEDDWQTL